MKAEHRCCPVLQNDGFHVVEHVDVRDAAEEATCALHAAKERTRHLAQRKL